MFQSISNKTPATPEKLSQISKTQKVGYKSAQQRIEDIMKAGYRLHEYRQAQYDFPDENSIDETAFDETRRKGFDLADATQLAMSSINAIQSRKMALEKDLKDLETQQANDLKKLNDYKSFMKDDTV